VQARRNEAIQLSFLLRDGSFASFAMTALGSAGVISSEF
jgi:hypothetical protein